MIETKAQHDTTLATRLAMFRKEHIHKSQTKAAKLLGISQSNLSALERGLIPIRYDFIAKLVKEYNFNQDWYATGNGQSTTKDQPKTNLLTDITKLNEQMEMLKKHVKILELTHNHMLKVIEQLEQKVVVLEAKNKKKS